MAYQYTNRRGDVYFIQAKDRKGKTAYSAARKPSGDVLDNLPDGYELHELPENAQVVVRKIKPSAILAKEKQAVETAVRSLAKLEHFLVEVAGDSLIVYLTDTDPDRREADQSRARDAGESLNVMRAFAPMSPVDVQSHRTWVISRAHYTKMMRFTLEDAERRVFSVQRWCFLGSIDDWFYLGGGPLDKLLQKNVPHLGKESFYALM